jgi:hypothetical protein
MPQKLWFIIEDDWELRGNGLGSVAHLQHTSAVFLMDVCRALDMRVTFMAEVLQQLAMERDGAHARRLRTSTMLWRETVAQMIEEGHDVQLHLHPQWYRAELRDGFYRQDGSWNIADHAPGDIGTMVSSSCQYLRDLIVPLRPSYVLTAFKAGAWAMQPPRVVLEALRAEGIAIIMGPGRSVQYRVPGFTADYRAIEEPVRPYCPDPDTIERVAKNPNDFVVLPMPYYHYRATDLLGTGVQRLLLPRLGGGSRLPDSVQSAPQWVHDSPPSFVRRRTIKDAVTALSDLRTFDIAGASFSEMRSGFIEVVGRALATGSDIVPVVLQSHTKGYDGSWSDIRRFFTFVRDRYHDRCEFLTLSDVLARRSELEVRGSAADLVPGRRE